MAGSIVAPPRGPARDQSDTLLGETGRCGSGTGDPGLRVSPRSPWASCRSSRDRAVPAPPQATRPGPGTPLGPEDSTRQRGWRCGSRQGSHRAQRKLPAGSLSPAPPYFAPIAEPPSPSFLSILLLPAFHLTSPPPRASPHFSLVFYLLCVISPPFLHSLFSACPPGRSLLHSVYYLIVVPLGSRRPLSLPSPSLPVTLWFSSCRHISELCPAPRFLSHLYLIFMLSDCFQGCSQPPRQRSWSQALGNCLLEGGKALSALQIESGNCQRN